MGNEDRAARYHRLRRRSDLLSTAAAGLFLALLLLTGAVFTLREVGSFLGTIVGGGLEEIFTVVGVAIVLAILLTFIELPFAYYQGYLLEHRYGLSNESRAQWLRDHLKAGVLTMAITAVGASVIYSAMRVSPEWWWLLSATAFALFMVGLVQLAPVVLLPLFYKFQPLQQPALVARLLALAERARTKVGGVYEWTLSAHTNKVNAALAGMGPTRRILLSDTLLSSYSEDEIEVVLAHELSHHVHHDLWRSMALQTLLLFAGFFVAAGVLGAGTEALALRGSDDPAGLPLLMFVGGACSLLFMPVANALSRSHERRADRYALDATQRPAAFISAMKRLAQQNLAEEHPSPLVQWLFYSHPPIRSRIAAAERWPST